MEVLHIHKNERNSITNLGYWCWLCMILIMLLGSPNYHT